MHFFYGYSQFKIQSDCFLGEFCNLRLRPSPFPSAVFSASDMLLRPRSEFFMPYFSPHNLGGIFCHSWQPLKLLGTTVLILMTAKHMGQQYVSPWKSQCIEGCWVGFWTTSELHGKQWGDQWVITGLGKKQSRQYTRVTHSLSQYTLRILWFKNQ